MTRAPVAPSAHQAALNASNSLKSVAVALRGWTTWESACQAEAQLSRALEEIRAIKPILHAVKQDIRQRERRAAADRKVIERDREGVSEWRAIETAPRDGTLILIAPNMKTAWWDFGAECWVTNVIPLNGDRTIADDWTKRPVMMFEQYAHNFGTEPTHWQPLPEPPK